MRTTILPMTGLQFRPAFWGLDRDLKDVMENLESIWEGQAQSNEFQENEQAFFLSLDMPGVNKSNLDLQVEGEQLFIIGDRKNPFKEDEQNTLKIKKTVMLPKLVDKEKIQAHVEDGVLYLALPKIEKAKPRKIEISTTKSSAWKQLLGTADSHQGQK